MKFGFRTPSISKRIGSNLSLKKKISIRMPKGTAMFTNPKKAIYNKVYNKTTFGFGSSKHKSKEIEKELIICPKCNSQNVKDAHPITSFLIVILLIASVITIFWSWILALVLFICMVLVVSTVTNKPQHICKDCNTSF